MPRLKIYTAEVGFYELAVAAPSQKKAAELLGVLPSAFNHGIARQAGDAKAVSAAMADPGRVLRRPLGSKDEFTQNARLPRVPSDSKKTKTKPIRKDNSGLRLAQSALESAKRKHEERIRALSTEREDLDEREVEEAQRWTRELSTLQKALRRAEHPRSSAR